MSIFEKALRNKLRFQYRGPRTTEDLWEVPLIELNEMYKTLKAEQKAMSSEEDLLGTKSDDDTTLELKIELIKHIVEVRLQERKERENLANKKERKQKLLAILEEKQDENLRELSTEEIIKMIEEI